MEMKRTECIDRVHIHSIIIFILKQSFYILELYIFEFILRRNSFRALSIWEDFTEKKKQYNNNHFHGFIFQN